jgi:hypothetical protein
LAKEHSTPTGLRAGFSFRLGHSLSCGPYWLAVSSSALGLYVRVYLAHFPGLTSFLVHLAPSVGVMPFPGPCGLWYFFIHHGASSTFPLTEK